MITYAVVVAFLLALAFVLAWCGRALWGRPEEGASEWASALTPELAPSPVEVIKTPPSPQHAGATAAWSPAAEMSDAGETGDLVTFAEQLRGDDDWSGFDQAFVDYENALLTRQGWVEARTSENVGKPLTLRDMAFPDVELTLVRESTQQRIDRWLSEGGDGVRHHRADARMAASDTWDAPSGQMPVLDSYVADRLAEALLAS